MTERRWFAFVSFPLFVVSGASVPEVEAEAQEQRGSAGNGEGSSGASLFEGVTGRVSAASTGGVVKALAELGSGTGFFSNNKALRRRQAASKSVAPKQIGMGAGAETEDAGR